MFNMFVYRFKQHQQHQSDLGVDPQKQEVPQNLDLQLGIGKFEKPIANEYKDCMYNSTVEMLQIFLLLKVFCFKARHKGLKKIEKPFLFSFKQEHCQCLRNDSQNKNKRCIQTRVLWRFFCQDG